MPNNPILLFKYGGNAMTDANLQKQVLANICALKEGGYDVVIVHGGGPFIKKALEEARIESEFIDGQRKTTEEAFEYVEMALKGKVNGRLVSVINAQGHKAVGLSGKDGRMVIGEKRYHKRVEDGKVEEIDLGQVADVSQVDPSLIHLLLANNYVPVITCLASDREGNDYNINADMFAGHLAGALNAREYIVLTDVDGLLTDIDKPDSLVRKLRLAEIGTYKDQDVIKGGMIPKVESCEVALANGAKSARIINGTKPEQVTQLHNTSQLPGTSITND